MVLHLFPPFVVFDDTDDDIDLAAGAVVGTIVRRGAGFGSERGRSTVARLDWCHYKWPFVSQYDAKQHQRAYWARNSSAPRALIT